MGTFSKLTQKGFVEIAKNKLTVTLNTEIAFIRNKYVILDFGL